jgi:hypothetical protein
VYATITTKQGLREFGDDVAVADVDADGAGDVVVLSRRGVTAVMGTLAPGAEPGATTSQYYHDWPVEDRFAVADFAEEGSVSVVVGTEWGIHMDWVRELAGEPVADELASLTFFSISLGDVDGDGYGNDLVTRVRGSEVPELTGMLEVTTIQGGAARAPARLLSEVRIDAGNLVGDLDGDGADNLVVTASTDP